MWDWWRMFRARRLLSLYSPQAQQQAHKRAQNPKPLREIEREPRPPSKGVSS